MTKHVYGKLLPPTQLGEVPTLTRNDKTCLREQLLPPTQLGEVPTLTRNDKTCLREELLPPTQ